MEDSLIAALKSMLTMHRWNLHPRVETWVEAENAALRAHWAYAIIVDDNENVPPQDIIHLIFRVLLKSLNKHYMTDISVYVTEKLKKKKEEWKSLVNKYAEDTAKLFPREISGVIERYLKYEEEYTCGWGNGWGGMKEGINDDTGNKIKTIIDFCKYKVQKQEC